jgi:putative transposase
LFCLMPPHWHVVVGPERDGAWTAFLRWLTLPHAVRWHTH